MGPSHMHAGTAPPLPRGASPGHGLAATTVTLAALALVACADDSGTDPASNPATGGSGGSAGSGGTQPPLYESLACDLPAVIDYCGGTSCHYDGAEDLGSGLFMWDRQAMQMAADLETRIINLPATYNNVLSPERCPTEPELIVNTTDLEASLILKKLTNTQTCGDEMPKFPYPEWGATNNPGPQRDENVACIRAWVTLLVEDFNKTP